MECGSPYVEWHHCFPGRNRQIADKHGYLVPLCNEHHTGRTGVHQNKELMNKYKVFAQRKYEENHTRQDFIREFGKNYIMED